MRRDEVLAAFLRVNAPARVNQREPRMPVFLGQCDRQLGRSRPIIVRPGHREERRLNAPQDVAGGDNLARAVESRLNERPAFMNVDSHMRTPPPRSVVLVCDQRPDLGCRQGQTDLDAYAVVIGKNLHLAPHWSSLSARASPPR